MESNAFEIHYIARSVDPGFDARGYHLHCVGSKHAFARHSHLFDARKLYSTLKSISPDSIYQRVGCAYTGIAALYAKKNGCSMLWHVASDQDLKPLQFKLSKNIAFRHLEKKALEYGVKHATNIVVQTRQQKKLLEQNYGRTPSGIVANFHPAPPLPPPKDSQIHVVWVANLKPLKQPRLFMKMAERLHHHTKSRFTMIGRNSNWRWGRELQKEISETGCVDYIGEQPFDKVNEILAQAHILVNTSQYEGFPNTFIQAWMREVPVVSLNANPDNVLDRHGVGLACHGDFEQLVKNVNLLIENRELRTSLARNARSYALEYHSNNNGKQLVQLLAEKTER